MRTFPLAILIFTLTSCSGAKKDSSAQLDAGKEISETVTLPAVPVWYEGAYHL